MAEGYVKSEIPFADEGQLLVVNVSVNIIGFLKVDEIGQTLKVAYEVKRTWFDSRLTFRHLQKDPDMNYLWETNHERIWYPKIHFQKLDHLKGEDERHLLFTVLRDSNIRPRVRQPGTINATNEFRGSEHKIERSKDYAAFWRCVFNLEWFPFDRQTCTMWMRMPRHNRKFVKFFPQKIEYKGNKAELTEYSVDQIQFCSVENGTQLVLSVTLGRPLLGSILTIYIPTLLLLIIRFGKDKTQALTALVKYSNINHTSESKSWSNFCSISCHLFR